MKTLKTAVLLMAVIFLAMGSIAARSAEQQTNCIKGKCSNLIFSYTFNDENYVYRFYQILKKQGLVATAVINTHNIGKRGYLSLNQVKELMTDGWEIRTEVITTNTPTKDEVEETWEWVINNDIGLQHSFRPFDETQEQNIQVFGYTTPEKIFEKVDRCISYPETNGVVLDFTGFDWGQATRWNEKQFNALYGYFVVSMEAKNMTLDKYLALQN